MISKYRPKCPIIAITPFDNVARSLSLNFGVIPKTCAIFDTTDEIMSEAKKVAKELNIAKAGDSIVVAAGMPSTETGGTNMLKIEKI